MEVRWLGWAGIEVVASGSRLVVDVLADAAAVFAPFGDAAAATPKPALAAPQPGAAVAALVTHLHRDHADAAAIAAAVAENAIVLEPAPPTGEARDNLALLQAEHELAATGLDRRAVAAWESAVVGPFSVTALPAVDGLGDPQVSWLIEADGMRLLHLGDTMFHGYWWRIASRYGPFDAAFLPVNGPVVAFPHRQPSSPFEVAMSPAQAAVAAELLAPRLAVPIHADGYDLPGAYRPVAGAAAEFERVAGERGVAVRTPQLGEWIGLGAAALGEPGGVLST